MRIVSWNINGIRTLPQYHPWNTIKKCSGILQELGGDITCFQEVKTTRNQLTRDIAVPEPFDAFFSFPATKFGYSGVATFVNPNKAPVIKAEEGLSRYLGDRLKPPLSPEERVSSYSAYPLAHDFEFMPDEAGDFPSDFADLESEGRAIVNDFGRFVLINTYCPNEGSDERLPYKMNFHRLLGERVRLLIKEGREVIVVGDINICAAPIDYVEGDIGSNAIDFWGHPAKAWFKDWIGPNGPMVDVIRRQWPGRKSMYTCWNTKISARETNYGARIDYILLTHGLIPWFKFGDIQPSIKGSDHCPIYVDLHDEITDPSTGQRIRLFESSHFDAAKVTPRICAKNWPEYAMAQRLLSTFFGKGKKEANVEAEAETETVKAITTALNDVRQPSSDTSTPSTTLSSRCTPSPTPQLESKIPPANPSSKDELPLEADEIEIVSITPKSSMRLQETSDSNELKGTKSGKKRKGDNEDPPSKRSRESLNKTKTRSGQVSINSFFQSTDDAKPTSRKITKSKSKTPIANTSMSSLPSEPPSSQPTEIISFSQEVDLEADFELARKLAEEGESENLSSSTKPEDRKSWSKFFQKHEPPKCVVHNEPCKELVTNKPGPNKGKYFWICSRPVGPGYDSGRSRRLREDVDPQYRCDFFKWSRDARKEALR